MSKPIGFIHKGGIAALENAVNNGCVMLFNNAEIVGDGATPVFAKSADAEALHRRAQKAEGQRDRLRKRVQEQQDELDKLRARDKSRTTAAWLQLLDALKEAGVKVDHDDTGKYVVRNEQGEHWRALISKLTDAGVRVLPTTVEDGCWIVEMPTRHGELIQALTRNGVRVIHDGHWNVSIPALDAAGIVIQGDRVVMTGMPRWNDLVEAEARLGRMYEALRDAGVGWLWNDSRKAYSLNLGDSQKLRVLVDTLVRNDVKVTWHPNNAGGCGVTVTLPVEPPPNRLDMLRHALTAQGVTVVWTNNGTTAGWDVTLPGSESDKKLCLLVDQLQRKGVTATYDGVWRTSISFRYSKMPRVEALGPDGYRVHFNWGKVELCVDPRARPIDHIAYSLAQAICHAQNS